MVGKHRHFTRQTRVSPMLDRPLGRKLNPRDTDPRGGRLLMYAAGSSLFPGALDEREHGGAPQAEAIGQYLRDIHDYPMLTPEQEVALAHQIFTLVLNTWLL